MKAFDTCIQALDKNHNTIVVGGQSNQNQLYHAVIMLAAGSWRLVFDYEGGKTIHRDEVRGWGDVESKKHVNLPRSGIDQK